MPDVRLPGPLQGATLRRFEEATIATQGMLSAAYVPGGTGQGERVGDRPSQMILVAGPYRSGTNGDPWLIECNVAVMTEVSLRLFRAGHLPVMGEWLALPLIDHAGSAEMGDAIYNEIFHPIARRLVEKCDACLRIGGPSAGADEMVALAIEQGKTVYYSLEEIQPVSTCAPAV